MHRLSVVLLLLVASLVPATLATSSASAAGRCTITGTAGDDVLVGTPRSDVLCGRGGDDTLRGEGGHDTLYGGSGNDHLDGGGEEDHLHGGAGDDLLGGGRYYDHLHGGSGDDQLRGGPQDDELRGGRGADSLEGGAGEDWLFGAAGADTCPYDIRDAGRSSCHYDDGPPEIVSLETVPAVVDVTDAGARMVFRAHLRDDNPIGNFAWQPYVIARSGGAHLHPGTAADLRHVSGSLRDGIWEYSARIPRGFPAGSVSAQVTVQDEAFTVVSRREEDLGAIRDEAPDVTAPELELVSPTSDARVRLRDWMELAVRVRASDDLSGVGRIGLCLEDHDGREVGLCAERTRLVSGTRLSGTWEGVVVLPPRVDPGDVGVRAWAVDRARPATVDRYYGCAVLSLGREAHVGESGCLTLVGRE